ncbi:hypothetical protein EV122DRAFT_196029, partial [Schizophyllum commune]
MGRKKVSNIAHYHRGTTHPNAGGRKAGKGEGPPRKSKSTQSQVSLSKRTLDDADAVLDLGKENQGPIKVPAKRRKIAKEPTDIAPAASVTTQSLSTASHAHGPILLATAISGARQVAESVQSRYLLPMPQPAVLRPRLYPAT